MKLWHPDIFELKRDNLQNRMQIIRSIRRFFEKEGFWEVETPIIQDMPGADTHIHAYQLENKQYLHNSPEFAMKKLLVAGVKDMFQITHAFRKEEISALHSPEFTLLEWYRSQANYKHIMQDCEQLLKALDIEEFQYKDKTASSFNKWQYISVEDAFLEFAGFPLEEDLKALKEHAKHFGIRVIEQDKWDDVFHAVMAEKIEPNLGIGSPTILYDYPASLAALATLKENNSKFAQRFELYICGIEIANAYTELVDPAEQKQRFVKDMQLKEDLYGYSFPIDDDFIEALGHGMPACAGIALGIDRLVMLACKENTIKSVMWL